MEAAQHQLERWRDVNMVGEGGIHCENMQMCTLGAICYDIMDKIKLSCRRTKNFK